jgi:hypothetical protein
MSDDEDISISDKLYSTPESKEKTRSKFKNLLDDIELKMQKQNKKNVTNSNLETNSNTNKPEKNDDKNISTNNDDKKIKNFNSSVNFQSKKFEKNKKIKDNNKNALIQRMKKDNDKKQKNVGRNSINVMNKINISINHNNKKLRPSTPGLRDKEEEEDNKNNINNKENKKENKEKEIIDPLYIPHIVKDPLDILKQKISKILELSNEDIGNLSNKISLMDTELEAALAKEHENYALNLEVIYREKENKLKETYKKYDFALYKMFKTYGEKNNAIYDEMMKDKVDQILEIEQEFNIKKNKIKNNFNEKIEEIKRNYEKKRQEQDITNKDMIKNIKNKSFNILYDKNINNNKNGNNNNVNYNTFNNNEDENKNVKKTKSFFSLKKK